MTAEIIPINRVKDSDDGLIRELTQEEQVEQILQREFPLLCNDILAVVGRPFRLIFDPSIPTACTDCHSEIRISPWFFLEGQREVGYGTAYHEAGHNRFSRHLANLMARANQEGGEVLQTIANIMMDCKDDHQLADFAPGFAPRLRGRLHYICTMARREELKQSKPHLSQEQIDVLLRNFKPQDVYEDFFMAAKGQKSPRFLATNKALRLIRRKSYQTAPEAKFLDLAKRVRKILGEPKQKNSEQHLVNLLKLFLQIEGQGKQLSPQLKKTIRQMVKNYLGAMRVDSLKKLDRLLKAKMIVFPGPISTGKTDLVPVVIVKPEASNEGPYESLLNSIQEYVSPLLRQLKTLDNPSEFTLFGQDEGDLDLDEVAKIAAGLPGFYKETVVERNIDARIDLAIDCSGSMAADKILLAKRIATVFSEGVKILNPALVGQIWGYNSQGIYDCGPCSNQSGFVNLEGGGGNSDTHMLIHVGNQLAKAPQRRKVLIALCDDGPDNLEEARKLAETLWARGIIVIHILVGVHGAPDIFPVELIYDSMEDCLEEFGEMLQMIMRNLK